MSIKTIIVSLFQSPAKVGLREKIVSAVGAFLGIFLAAVISHHFGVAAGPLLIASMGASSVLLFAAPHSPMAQPWPFVGGHLISALIGVACYRWIPDPHAAAAAAVALAIFAMHLTHSLHPPGGATALAMVIGGAEMHRLGYGAMLDPVGLNVLVLMMIALLVNNLAPGRRYPLSVSAAGKAGAPSPLMDRNRLKKEDFESALEEMNAYIDVAEQDLEQIYTRASLHAVRRRMGNVTCRDIMRRDVAAAEFGDELAVVWERMRQHKLKGMPVVDRARRVIGIVTIVDFLKRADGTHRPHPSFLERLRGFIRRTMDVTTDKPEVVGEIMTAPAVTAREDTHVVALIPLFSEHRIHHVPIVDRDQRLVGMVTQSAVTETLYRYWAY